MENLKEKLEEKPTLEDIIKALEHDLNILDKENKYNVGIDDLRKLTANILFTLIIIFKNARSKSITTEEVVKNIGTPKFYT